MREPCPNGRPCQSQKLQRGQQACKGGVISLFEGVRVQQNWRACIICLQGSYDNVTDVASAGICCFVHQNPHLVISNLSTDFGQCIFVAFFKLSALSVVSSEIQCSVNFSRNTWKLLCCSFRTGMSVDSMVLHKSFQNRLRFELDVCAFF